ncbi:MAG: sucrose phosphorylase, partial [Rhodoglobus sp.]
MSITNGVQLIVYADRFGGSLTDAAQWVRSSFGEGISGIHYLPFFTPFDGADAGFDPVDHTIPDPRLGTWDDLVVIGEHYDLVVDVIVNHVSCDSEQFRSFVKEGEHSAYADMFLTLGSVFPEGATEKDLTSIYRPRPGLPFAPVRINGEPRLLWTTFTPQQIDIDVHSASGSAYLLSILDRLAAVKTKLIRLDAAGYAIKKAGTSSFMIPETFEFIDRFTAEAHARGMEVLVEIHSYYQTQIEIAARVDRVYDFALPPLLLHALFTGDLSPLVAWIGVRPENAITVLDTHDGIGVIDVGADQLDVTRPGLLNPAQIDALVERIHTNTGGESLRATGAAASNLDLYQVNSTYYDALGSDDNAYLTARAIQFFLPGIPQVYYVGALAGKNDMELLARTGVGRDINRHHYSADERDREHERPVVRALRALMTIRNTHAAFSGLFDFHQQDAGLITLSWTNG